MRTPSMFDTQPARAPRRLLTVAGVFLLILVLLGFLLWEHRSSPFFAQFLGTTSTSTLAVAGQGLIQSVTYTCDQGKSIKASFYDTGSGAAEKATPDSPPTPTGSPPTPTGSVALILSDGRTMTLPQTLSGSGIRFANGDETFIFWSKGNTAFVEEGSSQDQTYTGCVTASALPGEENWSIFSASSLGVSVRYPAGYVVKSDYTYTLRGPDLPAIPGVKFVIPASLWQGTNLSGFDTGVSVEELSDATSTSSCTASLFLDAPAKERSVSDNGVDYSVASTSDAGAGNFYENAVWAIKGSQPCTAVRYFIHSTNVGNYTPGTVQAYDRQTLLSQFDQIRRSLVLVGQ